MKTKSDKSQTPAALFACGFTCRDDVKKTLEKLQIQTSNETTNYSSIERQHQPNDDPYAIRLLADMRALFPDAVINAAFSHLGYGQHLMSSLRNNRMRANADRMLATAKLLHVPAAVIKRKRGE